MLYDYAYYVIQIQPLKTAGRNARTWFAKKLFRLQLK